MIQPSGVAVNPVVAVTFFIGLVLVIHGCRYIHRPHILIYLKHKNQNLRQ